MTVTVREAMTVDPMTLLESSTLRELHELMESRRIRHVPIVDDDGVLVGVVSHRDLVRAALHDNNTLSLDQREDMLSCFNVSEIMSHDPQTVEAGESLQVAGEMIFENKLGCLPVIENAELVGILTESDFVRYTIEQLRDPG